MLLHKTQMEDKRGLALMFLGLLLKTQKEALIEALKEDLLSARTSQSVHRRLYFLHSKRQVCFNDNGQGNSGLIVSAEQSD